ncbi:MAG: hypothetical protein ACQESF_03275 [Nanobdellota archaeon]
MDLRCLKCKGRGFCGRSFCPRQLKLNSMIKSKGAHSKKEFTSMTPTPFVGRFGYPDVNVGLLAVPEGSRDAWKYDSPKYWSDNNFTIPRLVNLRSKLLNSRFKSAVYNPDKAGYVQEAGLSSKPVDVDFSLEDKPKFRLQNDSITAPRGPEARLVKAKIVSNPKISRSVDKVNSDTDLKAVPAMDYLYSKGYDENFLSKILSVGGIGRERKMVPTRWSITSVDDTLGNNLIKEINDFKEVGESFSYFGEYLGNYYLISFLPGQWGYELFETSLDATENSASPGFTTDYEFNLRRKEYAHNCAGGYYSVRLAVLEKLKKMKRKASCLAIRVITGEYSVPLGVWVTRQAARNALDNKPIRFSSKDLLCKYSRLILNKKFSIDCSKMLNNSKILSFRQKSLDNFFKSS